MNVSNGVVRAAVSTNVNVFSKKTGSDRVAPPDRIIWRKSDSVRLDTNWHPTKIGGIENLNFQAVPLGPAISDANLRGMRTIGDLYRDTARRRNKR